MTTDKDLYNSWSTEIIQALKREKDFRKEGRRVVRLYEAKDAEREPFAILYSNTETLAPAVYNQRPIPFVDRRFKDEDPLGKAAAEVGTRLLKYLIDVESQDYDNFDELVNAGVLDTLITNRGNLRLKYKASADQQGISDECVYGEAVRWDKFFHGYARTWKKVPWIGFEWDMSPDEIKQNFPDYAASFDYDAMPEASLEENTSVESRQETIGVKLAKVYEIWDKITRKVYFFSPCYKEGPLRVVDDPLELANFFPIPKPLNFMRKISTLVPTPLYIQYEAQAKELNELTRRLKAIIQACKVRGMYNSTVTGIEKLLQSEDNEMTPLENMQSMPENMAIDKMFWFMPLDMLATTAQQLYQQRESVKQVIYEITGISDILRGASMASETATAQNIKNQWGTLRLKKMQKEVQRYCRDALRIMLEIAVTKFDIKTISGMTGLKFPTKQEKAQAQATLQAIQNYQAQLAQSQPPADPSMQQQAPAQPPQLPPAIQQQLEQAQQIVGQMAWEDIIDLLKNDIMRNYRVDIETNSTIDAEASQDKQDIAELLNALSQFLNGIAPLIENGSMPFDVAKGILLAICRRYTFGPQVEEALEKMTAPPPPSQDNGDQAKLQAIQAQSQADQATAQAQIQQTQLKMQAEAQKAANDKEANLLEHQIRMQELQANLVAMERKAALDLAKHNAQMAALEARAKAAKPPEGKPN